MEPDKSYSVLVVDDEPSIRDALSTALRYEGYEVIEADTGRKALSFAQERNFSIAILDIMLPDIDGLSILKRMRQDGIKTPVLFLTARDGLEDKLKGLTLGGDDYVTKPFSLSEVIARVQAIIRRSFNAKEETILRFSDVELNEETHEVFRSGIKLNLTPTEFSLLRFFLKNPRKVLSKLQIIDHVWHYDFGGDMNVVETYISYLRKKLDTCGPPLIHTIRLVGYIMREPN
jgi:two-component system OmpR family response regulator